jgi:drug/metabolite transporter (DMT)-like permease
MNWLFFALLAPFFWALSSFIDKYSLEKNTKGPYDFVFFSTLFSWVTVPTLLFFYGLPALNIYLIVPVLSGFILIYSYIFYAKALEKNDASNIVILLKLIPVLVLAFGFIFLKQSLSYMQIVGFIIVILGAIIGALEKDSRGIIKGAGVLFLAILMWSAVFLLSDYGLSKVSFWDYIMLEALGSVLAGLSMLIFPKTRTEIIKGVSQATKNKYYLFTVNGIVDLIGQVTIKKALLLAPSAALVTVVVQVQSVYAVAMGIIFTLAIPKIINEDISKEAIIKKAIAAVIMFSGIYILFVI